MFVKKTVCVPFVEADTNGPCTVAMVGPEGVYGPAAPCPAAPAGRCDAAVAAALQDVADRLNRIENRMAVIESRGGAAAAPDGCAAPVGPVCRPPVSDRKCFLKSLCPTPANKDGCR
jgi:hypothetical protein